MVSVTEGSVTEDTTNEQAVRSRAGHPRSPAAEDSGARTAPRVGDQPAIEPGFERRTAGERRIVVSGPLQTRTGRLDQGGVEDERARPPRQVLFADCFGPPETGRGGRGVAAIVFGDQPRDSPEGSVACTPGDGLTRCPPDS